MHLGLRVPNIWFRARLRFANADDGAKVDISGVTLPGVPGVGEKTAIELVQTYGRRVSALVLRMLGNRAEAEDVAQEVFITVFKQIENFRGDSKFSTWLYRVTVNHCKNRIKYLARRHDRDRDELDETSQAQNGA